MKNLILLFILSLSISAVAQRDEVYVKEATERFVKELQDRGVEQLFTSKRYCLGKTEVFRMPNDSICFSRGTYIESYVVWKEYGRHLIKKIDNCGLFQTVIMSEDDTYSYFEENLEKLKTNEVKPYKVRRESDAPLLRTAIHSCRRTYTFYDGDEVTALAYNMWDMESNEISENLNFEHNDKLEIAQLDYLMDYSISNMENDVKYKRMRYTPPRRPSRN